METSRATLQEPRPRQVSYIVIFFVSLDICFARMDWVRVPADLPVGEYVLSFRWDSMDMQVWVSCANVKIIS